MSTFVTRALAAFAAASLSGALLGVVLVSPAIV
jgi:hypothetical protein